MNDSRKAGSHRESILDTVRKGFFEGGYDANSIYAFGFLCAEIDAGRLSKAQLLRFVLESGKPNRTSIEKYKAEARDTFSQLIDEGRTKGISNQIGVLINVAYRTHDLVEKMGATLEQVNASVAKNVKLSDKIAASAMGLTADMGKAVASLDGVTHRLVANSKVTTLLVGATKEVLKRANKLLDHTDPKTNLRNGIALTLFGAMVGFGLGVAQQKYLPIAPDKPEGKNEAVVTPRGGDFATKPSHRVSLDWVPPRPLMPNGAKQDAVGASVK